MSTTALLQGSLPTLLVKTFGDLGFQAVEVCGIFFHYIYTVQTLLILLKATEDIFYLYRSSFN